MFSAISRKIFIVAVLASIVFTQYFYNFQIREREPKLLLPPPQAEFIKAFNLGLNSATASFLWINTMLEVVLNPKKFLSNLNLINDLDPKFSFPYAYAVLVIPSIEKFPNKFDTAVHIGKRGLSEARPDWRIPFYLAMVYELDLQDTEEALKYFDIAARTPGAPYYIRRFGTNYKIASHTRGEAKNVWQSIYEDATDEFTKERAKTHVERLELFDILEEAAEVYFKKTGDYPLSVEDLVRGGIIKEMPNDPLGFPLYFRGSMITVVNPDDTENP